MSEYAAPRVSGDTVRLPCAALGESAASATVRVLATRAASIAALHRRVATGRAGLHLERLVRVALVLLL